MTYVDTIIFEVTMVGANLAIALLFASTVLSLKWWKPTTIHRLLEKGRKNISKIQVQEQSDPGRILPSSTSLPSSNSITRTINSETQSRAKSKAQTLQLKQISSLNELINRNVKSCEMVDVGHVIGIDKQSMTILHETGQKYTISTYYIREYNQGNIIVDISIKYLYHYKSGEKSQL